MVVVDIVNLNGDASCLPAGKWLRCLKGGDRSQLVQLLQYHIDYERPVNLGIVGATAKDIAHFNPEAIALINDHPKIFEMVLRPFAHDSPLLRLPQGFELNLRRGMEVLEHLFDRVNRVYLPPEHMVTSEQITVLSEAGIRAVFLHANRYSPAVRSTLPSQTFPLFGVLDATLPCIPFVNETIEGLTLHVLRGTVETRVRNDALLRTADSRPTYLWRDGESSFLWPLGLEYERRLLESEAEAGVERALLSQIDASRITGSERPRFVPLQSLKPWLDEMKLYWFVSRIAEGERRLADLSKAARAVWLLTINSDVLSAAEKGPPVLDASPDLLAFSDDEQMWEGVLVTRDKRIMLCRSERFGEGEDYLAYFERIARGELAIQQALDHWKSSGRPHLAKAYARVHDEVG